MTAEREPLQRWRYPKQDVVEGNVFPEGAPPFGPFPTVTMLMNANLCPVALSHALFHGLDNALIRYPQSRRGEVFHGFCAFIKWAAAKGTVQIDSENTTTSVARAQHEFRPFCRGLGLASGEIDTVWRLYAEPWLTRKIEHGEFDSLENEDVYFELSVASGKVPFELGNGLRHYPLRGRIDELNLTKRTLIERTIREPISEDDPPLLKDYQAWLLFQTISSLSAEQLPPDWPAEQVGALKLVVETPLQDFIINPDQSRFVQDTHFAYAWLDDMSRGENPGVFREVYENAACTPEAPHEYCSHPSKNCFPRLYSHPRSRQEVKRAFKPWLRSLLWERIWKGDLWHYRLLTLSKAQLEERGYIIEVPVQARDGDEIVISISGENRGVLGGYPSFVVLSYGTVNCGLRLKASIKTGSGDLATIHLSRGWGRFSSRVVVLSTQDTTSVIDEPITWLEAVQQRNLLRLKYWTMGEQTAREKSNAQLLEAVYGTRDIGSSDE